MKSKKALFEYLDAYYCHREPEYARDGLKHPNIANETYGKKSCIYIYPGKEMHGNLKQSLNDSGFKVSKRYGGDHTIEVQVSYFKGFLWDE